MLARWSGVSLVYGLVRRVTGVGGDFSAGSGGTDDASMGCLRVAIASHSGMWRRSASSENEKMPVANKILSAIRVLKASGTATDP